jgi:hypothetical protein
VASQLIVPVHVSGSVALLTVVHAPVPVAHAVHAPLHAALAQQKPSLHVPLAQSVFAVHAAPDAPCA